MDSYQTNQSLKKLVKFLKIWAYYFGRPYRFNCMKLRQGKALKIP